jgi:uncharacterized repeat protein (TIGR04138 family)
LIDFGRSLSDPATQGTIDVTKYDPRLAALVRRDTRYAYEAYEFVYDALDHTHRLLGHPTGRVAARTGQPQPDHHVTGPQLLHGIRDLALQEFGLMARTVFRIWGINSTGDFGEIVFNLIEAEMMLKTPEDNRRDFQDVYDLDQELVHGYVFALEDGDAAP